MTFAVMRSHKPISILQNLRDGQSPLTKGFIFTFLKNKWCIQVSQLFSLWKEHIPMSFSFLRNFKVYSVVSSAVGAM